MLISYKMDKSYNMIIIALSISFLALAIKEVQGGAMVSGTVFCDQCRDGKLSMFDYPLSGIKVTMICPGSEGQMTVVGQDTTNIVGGYSMTFDGTPDLSKCYSQISSNTNGPSSSGSCRATSGPPKPARLMFSMFDMAMYTVDPLISQPASPMSSCPKSSATPSPVTLPPPATSPPPTPVPVTPVSPPSTPKAPSPAFRLPPMPPAPLVQATACPYEYWMMPEYKCYWRAVNPDMPVALAFGPLAAEKYGTNMTLWKGLQGRGGPYKTLLRESETALLNSYNSFQFSYNALEVLHRFNTALMGSTRSVLMTALRFKRANSGHGRVPCKLKACH